MRSIATTLAVREAAAAQPATRRPIGWRAIVADGSGHNTYLLGSNCRTCDPTYDPMRRYGVPCEHAYWHAVHAVQNWAWNGRPGGRVAPVYGGAA